MTLSAIVIMIMTAIGAVITGKQKRRPVMILCISVSVLCLFYLVSVNLLLGGID